MIATMDIVIEHLDAYLANWQRMRGLIPYAIKSSIITQIVATGSIDTRKFLNAVDVREGGLQSDGYRFFIDSARDSEVTYDGFVETDGITRRWIGRFNYRDGISNTRIEPITDQIADYSFAR